MNKEEVKRSREGEEEEKMLREKKKNKLKQ